MTSPHAGYYRYPTIAGDTLVFVSEDDLWTVPTTGGTARRLTSGLGACSHPRLSRDGRQVAFVGTEEGVQEVCVIEARGGVPRRLTWLGANSVVVGWTPHGHVAFSTDARSPFFRDNRLFSVDPEGGEPVRLPFGLAAGIDFAPDGAVALCRHADDLARWKRYKGGRVGVIWVDAAGSGDFRRLIDLGANQACPMWVDGRVFFLSDHEYVANLYSCAPDGTDLKRHTEHEAYARFASTDGRRIVYTCGADLYVFDPRSGTARVDVDYRSPRTQLQRKFPDPAKYLEQYDLHPDGHTLVLTVRGKPVVMGDWEGAPVQLGERQGVRHRLATFLPDGARVVLVSDRGGEEALEICAADGTGEPDRLEGLDVGRLLEIAPDPTGRLLAFANHRHEVGVVDLKARTATTLDRSQHVPCSGLAWSADGRWLAFVRPAGRWSSMAEIRLYDGGTGAVTSVTDGRYGDTCPSFDPDGRWLYFLSSREFQPVYDAMYFDLGFPHGMRPYAVTLQADGRSPFQAEPRPLKGPSPEANGEAAPAPVRVDLDGLADRIEPFPVPDARYHQIVGLRGRVLLTREPVVGTTAMAWTQSGPPKGTKALLEYDFERQELIERYSEVNDFRVDRRGRTLAYRSGPRLRVVPASEPPWAGKEPPRSESPSRRTGWIDLARAAVAVDPRSEWRQMFRETWVLMREHFWTPDMSGVDWPAMYERYRPLLDRVGSRAEYSDLVWEMVGELGTSHAYEMLGDYREPPAFRVGQLAAEWTWDEAQAGWRVTDVHRGEPGDPDRSSPLLRPGVDVRPGDVILAVNGARLSAHEPPEALLANRAAALVRLDVARDGAPRSVTVRTLGDATPVRYRDWVRRNRQVVHDRTGGRVGYVHVPDMGPPGYAEFHRDYLREADRDALIVDVRFNRGGHVSQLLLEKLARKPIGFTVSRWGQHPTSYPAHTVLGPMVALTNEMAGSDGDIFSHNFKQMGLGPLIGTRTWGGVIGIWPRHRHTDGSMTTQPEFSNWYADVGWGVENHGTDPDDVVDIRPQDYAAGKDPQLERALETIEKLLAERPFAWPAFDGRPHLGP